MIQCDALMFDTLYYNLNYMIAISGLRFGLLVQVLPIVEPKPIKRFGFDPLPKPKSNTTFVVKVEFESSGKMTLKKCSKKEQHKVDYERKWEHEDQCQHKK